MPLLHHERPILFISPGCPEKLRNQGKQSPICNYRNDPCEHIGEHNHRDQVVANDVAAQIVDKFKVADHSCSQLGSSREGNIRPVVIELFLETHNFDKDYHNRPYKPRFHKKPSQSSEKGGHTWGLPLTVFGHVRATGMESWFSGFAIQPPLKKIF